MILGTFMRKHPACLVGVAVVTLLAAGCATTPPEEDPVQIKLNELDARVAKIERVITNQSLVELAQHLDSTQAEVRQLRGRLDELEKSNDDVRKQERDLYGDLDKRITTLQGGAPGAGGSAGIAGPSGSSGAGGAGAAGAIAAGAAVAGAAGAAGSAGGAGAAATSASTVEQTVYSQAFDALKAGSYSVAITGFKDFLTNYPSSPLAENAQYWLGEAYYVNRDFDAAAGAFRTVLKKWPDSRKAPDAMLKLGYTQFEQKQVAEGRATLTEVTQKFPDSDAAKLANDRLHRMSTK
jgi:tol-pal system protein YbgF